MTVTFMHQSGNVNLSWTKLMLVQKDEGPPPKLQLLLDTYNIIFVEPGILPYLYVEIMTIESFWRKVYHM